MIDPWILGFSLLTVGATIWMGFRAARQSKTASDFFVAGRGVSVGWNASAISGEYLSAASFMGIAGMVMSSGYDALWYPVCYACGYLFLLLFIAGPLRRFGAYTIPDFAEGRYDSPVFRKIAVVFVLFIGFFYTMPQMKGAGTTLAYVFPGLPYWAGVVVVGSVITLNVALGGMKGITLVQAFQYWAKMFAISIPVFVLMSVYGHYGRQLEANGVGGAAAGAQAGEASIRREALPPKAPADAPWLNPFGPLTTKAAKAVPPTYTYTGATVSERIQLNPPATSGAAAKDKDPVVVVVPVGGDQTGMTFPVAQIVRSYVQAVGTEAASSGPVELILAKMWADGSVRLDVRTLSTTPRASEVLGFLRTNGVLVIREGAAYRALPEKETVVTRLDPKPYALLYTYSLIMALVCGTAGLPHILVRFYTNPDGVAAKRTTMWVMILIGIFYVFPPVFGLMGRNLMPELYSGIGAKGTDKIVLELPKALDRIASTPSAGSGPGVAGATAASAPAGGAAGNAAPQGLPWGSILSGITCAGAFAAFMSTFSGLLVSMTGALAHDVYGRILRPQSTARERMAMFKLFAWLIGGVATLLGCFVEPLQINFMVGQAFAIAAASYFPLLFMSVWWRKMTMRGAATGMLAGGIAAVAAVSVTNFSDLGWVNLQSVWLAHPLLRILCEQPAIWAVPGAIFLMVIVSLRTQHELPSDTRMKMLVLHAPEELGLKAEYIREHEGH
jgi:Na+(H+)/acetate symporter ActP